MKLIQLFARILIQATLLIGAVAHASPITYTFTGEGSGSLNGTAFTNKDFTITAIGNTSSLGPCCGGNAVLDTSASIDIAGVSTVNFLFSTSVFYESPGLVLFMRTNAGNLYDGEVTGLSGWNMTSAVGPVDGSGTLLQWYSGVSTSGGNLVFDNSSTSPFTFEASTGTVPEPSALWLLAIGLAAAGMVTRIQRNRS